VATTYATFFAWLLTLAHRFLAAFAIAALPAAGSTRFLAPFRSRFAESPNAFASLRIGLLCLAGGAGVIRIRSGRRSRVLLFTCKEQLR